jgi:alkylated DNA repair dioxygenase AlkB
MEPVITHEDFIRSIRDLAVARLNDEEARAQLLKAKLVYGSGEPGIRGRCHYDAWKGDEHRELLEVCAMGEESLVQIAGTTLHELAHALAGWTAGHGPLWKRAARSLGLRHAEAAGGSDSPEDFEPDLLEQICAIPQPSDGVPSFAGRAAVLGPPPGIPVVKVRPCPLGRGTHGGLVGGPGSGSRLRLWVCDCNPTIKVRVASDDFRATCQLCSAAFKRFPPPADAPPAVSTSGGEPAATPVVSTTPPETPLQPDKEDTMDANTHVLEDLGFRCHELSDGCTFWTGELPQTLRLPPDAFDALWQTHPDEYADIRVPTGKWVKTPRWQQAYGRDYYFSGQVSSALPMTPMLAPFLEWAQTALDPRINGFLLNWYNAALGHYIGHHRDSRKGLVPGCPIITMSLGQSRVFRLRPWKGDGRDGHVDFDAHAGAVFSTPYDTNLRWTHEIVKTRQPGRRISITARAFEDN